MLEGDIEIIADIISPSHDFEYVKWEVRGVGIMEPYPSNPFYIRHTVDKFGQTAPFSGQIVTVGREILGNHVKLLDTASYEHSDLVKDFLNRSRMVTSRNQGYCTKSAESVTPFGYLDIGMMAGSGDYTVIRGCGRETARKIVDQSWPVCLTIPTVDLVNLRWQVVGIAFRQTPHYVKTGYASFFTGIGIFENRID